MIIFPNVCLHRINMLSNNVYKCILSMDEKYKEQKGSQGYLFGGTYNCLLCKVYMSVIYCQSVSPTQRGDFAFGHSIACTWHRCIDIWFL